MKQIQHAERGKIIPNGAKPEPQEMDTILFYTNLSKRLELIPASHTPKDKRPGFVMDGLEWEAKSPTVNTRKAIERLFYRAASQSSNVIMDLRRLKGSDILAIKQLSTCFWSTRKVRNLHIISKTGKLQKFKNN